MQTSWQRISDVLERIVPKRNPVTGIQTGAGQTGVKPEGGTQNLHRIVPTPATPGSASLQSMGDADDADV